VFNLNYAESIQDLNTTTNVKQTNSLEEEFFSQMYESTKETSQNELERYLEKPIESREIGQGSDWIIAWWKVFYFFSSGIY
jgi:hypothetical protein